MTSRFGIQVICGVVLIFGPTTALSLAGAARADYFVVSCVDGTTRSMLPQVPPEVGAICIELCRNPGHTLSCSVANDVLEGPPAPTSMKPGQVLWIRVQGTGVTVKQLGNQLRSLFGWKLDLTTDLGNTRLEETQLKSKVDTPGVLSMKLQDGRKIVLRIDLDSMTFVIRGK